jgi:ABC-type phosphonate transport system ATPase subunit
MHQLHDLSRCIVTIPQNIGCSEPQGGNTASCQSAITPIVIAGLIWGAFVIIVTVDFDDE